MKRLLILCLVLSCGTLYGQIAGLSTLSVLDASSSARTAGLGMDYLSVYDGDLTTGIDNPSLIDGRYHHTLSLNYVGLFSGSNFGSVNYGRHIDKLGDFLFGFHFNSYGRFEGYDETETETGNFFAADYVLSVGWGRAIDSSFSIGVNFKPVLSQYESYTALAVAIDLAGSYVSASKRFSSTLMARNIGAQLMTFDGTTESLPFELSAALSYKLANAPLRFFFAATELQRWNLRYDDELNPVVTYDPYAEEYTRETWVHEAADKLFRHAVFGVELSLKDVVFARLGYNYRQSAETHGTNNINSSGFSYGLGIRKNRFEFSFARNNYYLGKAPNYITISVRL